jgi:N-terminal region of glycosyl transferase group 7/N-terminal domain of galactosyltransferase
VSSTSPDPPVYAPARWLAKLWPSAVVKSDPLAGQLVDERYTPIPLAGWKLIPSIERRLLAFRTQAAFTLRADAKLGVIVPVRDREHQIAQLIPRLRRLLDEQRIESRILVSEQSQGRLWNKGAAINAGFRALAADCDYVCIHDVDAIPLEADYRCPSEPLRLVTHLVGSRHGPRREPRYFGGAISVKCDQFIAANGYSNEYWGWGKEDDDFLFRLWFCGRICFSDERGTFEDLPNPADQQLAIKPLRKPQTLRANRKRRSDLTRGLTDFRRDGLNSLPYRQTQPKQMDGYERILVTV